MLFSWDETKRRENWERRKVDLLEAALIFDDPEIVESVDTRNEYGEERVQALGGKMTINANGSSSGTNISVTLPKV